MSLLPWAAQGEKLLCEIALGQEALWALQGPFLGVWNLRVLLGSQNVILFSFVTYFSWKVPVCVADVVCVLLCAFSAAQLCLRPFNPNRGTSLPCAGHGSVCGPCGDLLILILWVQVSSRAVCNVGDLPSQNSVFSPLECDPQVTGTRVPELRCQPAPIDPLAWSDGASLQFSQPESLWVGRKPSVPRVRALLHPCDRGWPGELGWWGVVSLLRTSALLSSPLTVLRDAPSAQPCSAMGLCSKRLVAVFFLFENCIFSDILPCS